VRVKLSVLMNKISSNWIVEAAAEAHMLGCKCDEYSIENVVVEKIEDKFAFSCESCKAVFPVYVP
jgi:predicted SprT family Zn-dependent metalloprotease